MKYSASLLASWLATRFLYSVCYYVFIFFFNSEGEFINTVWSISEDIINKDKNAKAIIGSKKEINSVAMVQKLFTLINYTVLIYLFIFICTHFVPKANKLFYGHHKPIGLGNSHFISCIRNTNVLRCWRESVLAGWGVGHFICLDQLSSLLPEVKELCEIYIYIM